MDTIEVVALVIYGLLIIGAAWGGAAFYGWMKRGKT